MSRIQALRRIATMYGAVEQMRLVELQQATASLNEADSVLTGERELVREAVTEGRDALNEGNRAEWLLTETQKEYIEIRRPRLEALREERSIARDGAQAEFLASRAQTEQMKQVVKDMKTQAETEESRRLQAAMDDRFLMRLSWRNRRR